MVYNESDKIKLKKMLEKHDLLSMYISKDLNQICNVYAKNNNITKTQLIKNAIEEYCNVDLNNDFNLKN